MAAFDNIVSYAVYIIAGTCNADMFWVSISTGYYDLLRYEAVEQFFTSMTE